MFEHALCIESDMCVTFMIVAAVLWFAARFTHTSHTLCATLWMVGWLCVVRVESEDRTPTSKPAVCTGERA